jgi:hypothetical protein
MKAKLIKQFGKLKPGIYDWPEKVVNKLTDLGFVEKAAPKKEVKEVEEVKATPKRKKREKAVYEDKAESHEPENK